MKKPVISVFALVFCALLVSGGVARADFVYRLDNDSSEERFNNTQISETEDNWVANSFQVVPQGTCLVLVSLNLGVTFSAQPATIAIYRGSSLTDPTNLVRIATMETTITGEADAAAIIALDQPVQLAVGDIFYVAVLVRAVPGNRFLFENNRYGSPWGRCERGSFFDVGPQRGAPYDLDNTRNARVFGAEDHPVVSGEIQSEGNLLLRVLASTECTGGMFRR